MKKAFYIFGFALLFTSTFSCQSQGKKSALTEVPEVSESESPG